MALIFQDDESKGISARIDQHVENSRSSLSKHDFNMNRKSVMKLHSSQRNNTILSGD